MTLLQVLNEISIPVTGKTTIGKKLQNRNIKKVVYAENLPPDAHGIPKDYDSYGRGWIDRTSNSLEIDGGGTGSPGGHPKIAENGFYWGVKDDVLYIRGKPGTSDKWIKNNLNSILKLISKRVPR